MRTDVCTRNIGYGEASPEKSPFRHRSEQEAFLPIGDFSEDVFRERLHSHERYGPVTAK